MTNKLLTLSLALGVGLIIGLGINRAATQTASADVYAACMEAHYETDGASEQHCGDLQDKYNIEFLCNQTGTECWTEAK